MTWPYPFDPRLCGSSLYMLGVMHSEGQECRSDPPKPKAPRRYCSQKSASPKILTGEVEEDTGTRRRSGPNAAQPMGRKAARRDKLTSAQRVQCASSGKGSLESLAVPTGWCPPPGAILAAVYPFSGDAPYLFGILIKFSQSYETRISVITAYRCCPTLDDP